MKLKLLALATALLAGCASQLHEATRAGDLREINRLLQSGEDPNVVEGDQKTSPLHLAASLGQAQLEEALLKNGAWVDQKDAYGRTALFVAKNKRSAEVLLRYGALVNSEDLFKETPLFHAASRGEAELCQFLIEHGASVSAASSSGVTPLFATQSPDVVAVLAKNGVDLNQIDRFKQTALTQAATKGNVALVRGLVAAGADPNFRNGYNDLPIYNAIVMGKSEVVAAFLDAGSRLDGINAAGASAQDVAAKQGATSTQVLIANAIRIQERKKAQEAARLAEQKRQEEINARIAAQPCKTGKANWIFLSGGCRDGKAEGEGKAETIDRTETYSGVFSQGLPVNGLWSSNGKPRYEGTWIDGSGAGFCYVDGEKEPCEFKAQKRVDPIHLARVAREEALERERKAQAELDRLEWEERERERQKEALERKIADCERQARRKTDDDTDASCDEEGNLQLNQHNRGTQARRAEIMRQFNATMDGLVRQAQNMSLPPSTLGSPSGSSSYGSGSRPTTGSGSSSSAYDSGQHAAAMAAARARLEALRIDSQQKLDAWKAQQAAAAAAAAAPKPTVNQAPKPAADEWDDVQPEAMMACWMDEKRTLWWCDGPLQQTQVGEKDLETARGLVGCSGPNNHVNSIGVSGKYRLFGCGRGITKRERYLPHLLGLTPTGNRYQCAKNDRRDKCDRLVVY